MRLNINQKLVLLLNMLEFAKSVYAEHEPLPPLILERSRAIMKWLADNADTNSQESKTALQNLGNLPPTQPGEEYGAISIGQLELGEAIVQLMEAIVAADLSPDRIPDPPKPPSRVRNGRVENFQPRRGKR